MGEEPRSIVVENLEDLLPLTHRCTAGETLTKIQVDMAGVEGALANIGSCLQEQSARFEEHSKQIREFMNEMGARMRVAETTCSKEERWASLSATLTLQGNQISELCATVRSLERDLLNIKARDKTRAEIYAPYITVAVGVATSVLFLIVAFEMSRIGVAV